MGKQMIPELELPTDPTQPLTVEEAASFLRCATNTVYEALRSGKLHGVKVGKGWRITRNAIQAFLNNGVPVADLEDLSWVKCRTPEETEKLKLAIIKARDQWERERHIQEGYPPYNEPRPMTEPSD